MTKAVPSKQQLGRVRDTGERNPIGLAIGGVAVGFLVGTLLPSTRVENERLGEVSDRVVDAAKETAGEAVERGKQVAQDATQAATEKAKESGREQSEELTSRLQERAQEVTDDGSGSTPTGEPWSPSSGGTSGTVG